MDEVLKFKKSRRIAYTLIVIVVAYLVSLTGDSSPGRSTATSNTRVSTDTWSRSTEQKLPHKVAMTFVKAPYERYEELTQKWQIVSIPLMPDKHEPAGQEQEMDMGTVIASVLEAVGKAGDDWENVSRHSPFYLVHKQSAAGAPSRILGIVFSRGGAAIAAAVLPNGKSVITQIGLGTAGDDYDQPLPQDRLLGNVERVELAASFRKLYERQQQSQNAIAPDLSNADKVVIEWALHYRIAAMPFVLGGFSHGGEMIAAGIPLPDGGYAEVAAGARLKEFFHLIPGKNSYEGANKFQVSVSEEAIKRQAVEQNRSGGILKDLLKQRKPPTKVHSLNGA